MLSLLHCRRHFRFCLTVKLQMYSELLGKEKDLTTKMTLWKVRKMLRLEMFLQILAVHEPLRAEDAADLVSYILLQLDVGFVSLTVPVGGDSLLAQELLFAGVTIILQSRIGMN